MKKLVKLRSILTIFAMICASAAAVHAEHVFIKDGKIIEGKITADNKAGITVTLKDGSKKVIPRADLIRTLYTDEFLTKSFIQLADGESFEGFVVDEKRDTFVIRKKLYEPEEQVIKKNQIVNNVKKRPSKLAGHITNKGIVLTWNKTAGSIRKFVVYMKKQDMEYHAVDETIKAAILLKKGLEPDTNYLFAIRQVDDDNYESPPSNEIEVRTLKKGEKAPEFNPADLGEETNKKTAKKEESSSLSIGLYGTGGIYRQNWKNKDGITSKAGGGLLLDTAVAKDKLFNYRFNIDFAQVFDFRYVNKPLVLSIPVNLPPMGPLTFLATRYYLGKESLKPISINTSHAFGFGVLRTQWVRLWLGPELVINFMTDLPKKLYGGSMGLGLILGLNVNIGSVVTISLTGSVRALYSIRYYHYYALNQEGIDMSSIGFPTIPKDKKFKSLEHGIGYGGQMNLAVIFRIKDTYAK